MSLLFLFFSRIRNGCRPISDCRGAARDLAPGQELTFIAMTIVPAEKDWTWVLRRPCPEWGLDTSSSARDDTPAMILANAAAWREPLAAADAARRPRAGTWSPLEYGCHVRDVLKLYDYRLRPLVDEDDP